MLSQIIRFYGNAMQGMMGSYLEKNIQTFIEIQKRLQEQSRQVYGQNPMLSSEAWSEFVRMQGPAIQGLMTRYLEHSASAFMDMQQQLQQQTRNIFSTFPFGSFGAAPGKSAGPEEPAKGNSGDGKSES